MSTGSSEFAGVSGRRRSVSWQDRKLSRASLDADQLDSISGLDDQSFAFDYTHEFASGLDTQGLPSPAGILVDADINGGAHAEGRVPQTGGRSGPGATPSRDNRTDDSRPEELAHTSKSTGVLGSGESKNRPASIRDPSLSPASGRDGHNIDPLTTGTVSCGTTQINGTETWVSSSVRHSPPTQPRQMSLPSPSISSPRKQGKSRFTLARNPSLSSNLSAPPSVVASSNSSSSTSPWAHVRLVARTSTDNSLKSLPELFPSLYATLRPGGLKVSTGLPPPPLSGAASIIPPSATSSNDILRPTAWITERLPRKSWSELSEPFPSPSMRMRNASLKPHASQLYTRTAPPSSPASIASIEHSGSSVDSSSTQPHSGRLSSFQRWPQFVFPVPLTSSSASWQMLHPLRTSLETPYAFSHAHGRFHWTRADALADYRWNVWARPPCLNCVVWDIESASATQRNSDRFARGCNRWAVQENSEGAVRSCSQCVRYGNRDGCVEMIEVRNDGRLGYSLREMGFVDGPEPVSRRFFEKATWLKKEVDARKEGKVWWVPINLGCGDAEGKRALVEQWEAQGERRTKQDVGAMNAIERARRDRAVAQVAQWDEEESLDEPKQVVGNVQREGGGRGSKREDHLRGVDEFLDADQMQVEMRTSEEEENWTSTQKNIAKMGDDLLQIEPKRLQTEMEEQAFTQIQTVKVADEGLEKRIQEEINFWTNRVKAESVDRYDSEVERVGRAGAQPMEKEWRMLEGKVLDSVVEFVRLRENLKAAGLAAEDIERECKLIVNVRNDVRARLETLVPGLWDTGY